MRELALACLREAIELPDADFRHGQWESIEALLNRRRMLVVERTGWGKSMVYFLATRLLRDRGEGVTLLISPLLSLMRNQLEAAQRLNLNAETINSTNPNEWNEIEQRLLNNDVDLLLVSPERLANDAFQNNVLSYCSRQRRFVCRRRGALHFRLGTRFPSRLSAHCKNRSGFAAQRASACDYCHGQRPSC